MILFNVLDMAKELFFEEKVEASVRGVLAKELIDAAVGIFNHPESENTVIAEMLETWEISYKVFGLEAKMQALLETLHTNIKTYGWDPRCLAKVEYKGNGKSFLIGRVVMDLDQTFAKLHESIATEADANIVEVVSDNPDLETLNALATTSDNQTYRTLQILSGRSPSNLRPDEDPGWRTLQWENTGGRGV